MIKPRCRVCNTTGVGSFIYKGPQCKQPLSFMLNIRLTGMLQLFPFLLHYTSACLIDFVTYAFVLLNRIGYEVYQKAVHHRKPTVDYA